MGKPSNRSDTFIINTILSLVGWATWWYSNPPRTTHLIYLWYDVIRDMQTQCPHWKNIIFQNSKKKTYIRKKCFLHAANKCMFRIHPQTGRCKPSNTSVSTGAAKNIWNYLCSPQQNILYISLSFSIPWKRPFFSSVNVIYIYIYK